MTKTATISPSKKAELIEVLRRLHTDDPERSHRILADDITDLGYQVPELRGRRRQRRLGKLTPIEYEPINQPATKLAA